jgi:hypothetical protein
MNDTSHQSQQEGSPKHNEPKQVTFAEYSSFIVYKFVSLYERNKSYSSAERKTFRRQAHMDGIRVREIISACPFQNSETINHLIDRNVLVIEDIIGIEHFINEKGSIRVLKRRHKHTQQVLQEQEKLRVKNATDNGKLAEVSIACSAKCFDKAVCRAALAA